MQSKAGDNLLQLMGISDAFKRTIFSSKQSNQVQLRNVLVS